MIRLGLLVACLMIFGEAEATDTTSHGLDLIFRGNIGGNTPFWLQHNRYDQIPTASGAQLGLNYRGEYRAGSDFTFRWQAELYGRSDRGLDDKPFHQLYGAVEYKKWRFSIGKREEKIGEVQHEVSAGPTIWSGNARPMPKVKLELTDYAPVPLTSGWVSVKGGMAHGWFDSGRVVEDFYLHEKYGYLKIGKGPWPSAYLGLVHMAQWGGYDLRRNVDLSGGWDEYWRIFFGREGAEDGDWHSRENVAGNHLGSWQAGIQWSVGRTDLLVNHSTIFEDGTGFKLWSPEDGVWGLNIRQNHGRSAGIGRGSGTGSGSGSGRESGGVFRRGGRESYTLFTWEFWHTKSQSGPGGSNRPDDWEGDPRYDAHGNRFGGRDNYFNHTVYRPGWTYHDRILGVPFIMFDPEINQVTNNRLIAHHIGLKHQESHWSLTLFYTWTKNYGSYGFPLPEPLTQHHAMISFERDLADVLRLPLQVSAELGLDRGEFYGNRAGVLVGVVYRLL